jgi:hypothetical protein
LCNEPVVLTKLFEGCEVVVKFKDIEGQIKNKIHRKEKEVK